MADELSQVDKAREARTPAGDKLVRYLAQSVRARRKRLGLTLQDVSQKCGVTVGYLSQIELARNSPSLDVIAAVAEALGTSPGDLFPPPTVTDPSPTELVRAALHLLEQRGY